MAKKEQITPEAISAISQEIAAIRKQILKADSVASEWLTQKSELRIALNKELHKAMQSVEYAWLCEARKISN